MEEIERLVKELSEREDRTYSINKNTTRALLTFFKIDMDVLINNAGATWGESFTHYPDNAFDKVLTLNLKRVFSLTQA